MAAIGQQLLAPEPGWTRYEETDPSIKYFPVVWGTWSGAFSGGTISQSNSGNYFTVTFYGTDIRFIGAIDTDKSSNIGVYIDGVLDKTISQLGTTIYKVLNYEKTGLALGFHTMKIINNATGYLLIDALDIKGILCPYTPLANKIKTSTEEMNMGDLISCEYSATSNSFGVLKNLGKVTKNAIPITASATPSGSFYFIMVGYDSMGRKKLIPDRNLQHGISWDALNTAGVASGGGLPITIDGSGYVLRLMSGGVSATDKENEWDKIIVESTLNGTIAAGDNSVWNIVGGPTYGSWCSTASITSSIHRVIRGSTASNVPVVNGFNYSDTTGSTPSYGFRPVLLVPKTTNKYLLASEGNLYSYSPSLTVVGSYPSDLSESFFKSQGSDSPPNKNIMSFPDQFQLLTWTDFTEPLTKCRQTAVPQGKLILAKGDISLATIEYIESVSITSTNIKIIVSVDSGLTWKTWNGTSWISISPEAESVKVYGTSAGDLNALVKQNWTDLIGSSNSIRFGYFLDISSVSDIVNTDAVTMVVDMKGKWNAAYHGSQFDISYINKTTLDIVLYTSGDYKINY